VSPIRARARELGIDIWNHKRGRLNLITDVPGVAVGHCTIVRGKSASGKVSGIVRTGVTAVTYVRRDLFIEPLRAAVHVMNGFGKATGLDQIRETGRIETPVCITNTLSIWTVAETLVKMVLESHPDVRSVCPVVGECNDGYLNDIRGFHVKPLHVRKALKAAEKRFALGSVGAGTGMRGIGYKAGVGSASRVVEYDGRRVTLGVLAVVNTGDVKNLRIGGLPIGKYLSSQKSAEREKGSIILVLATDGDFTSRQLHRLAVRVGHGLARTGMVSGHSSGDYAIAFSTAAAPELSRRKPSKGYSARQRYIREEDITPFFEAVIEATEEAFIDGILTASTMDGGDGHVVESLDTQALMEILARAGITRCGVTRREPA